MLTKGITMLTLHLDSKVKRLKKAKEQCTKDRLRLTESNSQVGKAYQLATSSWSAAGQQSPRKINTVFEM